MSRNANRKDKFKNTIYENFFGSKVVDVNLENTDGTKVRVNTKKERMGAIYVNIDSGRLYEAWEESFSNEV